MGAVVLVARESGRPSGAAAALGLACWALLLADPSMVADIGFPLSVVPTAGRPLLRAPRAARGRRHGGAARPRRPRRARCPPGLARARASMACGDARGLPRRPARDAAAH